MILGFTALLWAGFGPGQAASESSSIFDSEQFWAAHPANFGAGEAWRRGSKWSADQPHYSAAVFHKGQIYGFGLQTVPPDQDKALQSRLNLNYAGRAESEAVHAAGLFAFSVFKCQELADYSRLSPDLSLCQKTAVNAKMKGEWSGQAFGVWRMPAKEICACRKALDQGQGKNNSDTFFGKIARRELRRLHQRGRFEEVSSFFTAHYKKKVFEPPEFLLASEALGKQEKFAEAKVLLDALTSSFADDLTSEQWEQCGDLYYQAGSENQAIQAYLKASETLCR